MDKLVYNVPLWHDLSYNALSENASELNEIIEQSRKNYKDYDKFSQEVFSRMFGNNQNKIKDVKYWNSWAEGVHQAITDIPEMQRLVSNVRGDAELSMAVITSLLRKINKTLPEKKVENELDIYERFEGEDPAKLEEALAENRANAEAKIDDVKVRSALRKEASELTEFTETVASLGIGDQSIGINTDNVNKYSKLYNKMKYDKKLRMLLDLCGNLQSQYRTEKRKMTVYERSEFSDITMGSELSRVLANQFLYEDLFDVKFVNNELLMHDVKAKETKDKGPVMMAIDFSGSMLMHNNYIIAQAIAVTLMTQLKKENRFFDCCLFGNNILYEFSHTRGDIIEFISFMPESGEGTRIEPVLDWMRERDVEDADALVITDGGFSAPASQKMKCNVMGVLIGKYADTHESFFDQCIQTNNLMSDAADMFRFVMKR